MSTGLSIDEILAQSESEGDPIPQEIQVKGDPAIKAYYVLRTKNKDSAALIRKQQEELDSFRKEKAERDAIAKPTVSTQGDSQAEVIWQGLVVRAMGHLGLTAIRTQSEQRLVDAEASRLYSDGISIFRRDAELRTTAPKIMADKIAGYGLDETDTKAIIERVSKYPVSQQVDDVVIRNEVHRYVGEKQFTSEPEKQDDDPAIEFNDDPADAPVDKAVVSSARVAASSVRNGRPNAGLTVTNRRNKPGPKPATPQELQEMRRLGLPDLAAYRYAKENKAKYANR